MSARQRSVSLLAKSLLSFASPSCATSLVQRRALNTTKGDIHWVFLGPPGVGKGTYASRVAQALGVPHIAAGDLVRAEMKSGSELGREMAETVNSGRLLPDSIVLELLQQRFEQGASAGERGFILDGFPRTVPQAQKLLAVTNVHLALNMSLREEVLIEKCLGRRVCTHCGKGYNVANIYLPASDGRPPIIMPPLSPKPECEAHLETRADDTEPVVRRRLEAYKAEAGPVEQFFRDRALLKDFEITAGIPETLPHLLKALAPFIPADKQRSMAALLGLSPDSTIGATPAISYDSNSAAPGWRPVRKAQGV